MTYRATNFVTDQLNVYVIKQTLGQELDQKSDQMTNQFIYQVMVKLLQPSD